MPILIYIVITFAVWRKMRRDYNGEDILTLSLLIAVVVVLGLKLGVLGGVSGGLMAVVGWCRFKKWDVWEWLDVLGFWSLLAVLIIFNWKVILVGILGMGVLGLVWNYYRSWRWYKSGKMGLVGLVSLVVWSVVSVIGATKIASVPVYSAVLVTFASLVAICLRSGLWQKNK